MLGKYPKQDEWKYSSFWYKDFDTMACGKVVKALLSGGDAPLSIEMQQAINADENVIEMSEDEEFHFGTTDNVSPDIPENIDEDGVVSDTTDETAENEQASAEEPKKATRAKRTAQTPEESQEEMSDMFFGNKKK